jgi:hypothetical protein
MPVDYVYREDDNLVNTTASGVVTLTEILQYIESVLSNPQIRKGYVEIVDLDRIDDIELTYKNLRTFPDLWKKSIEKGCVGIIIIAQSDLAFGLMRMLQTVVSTVATLPDISFVVCRSREDAETTLASFRADQSIT